MLVIVISAAALLCVVVLLLGCLNCLQRKKNGFSNFNTTSNSHDSSLAQNNEAFTMDMPGQEISPDHVVIEPLPDIVAKTSYLPSLRPRIVCLERGQQGDALSLISVQRSFPRKDLLFINEIGSGWFGKALESEALRINSGSLKSLVVVKMLKDDASKVEQKQFLEEVNPFRCLEHRNLMSLLGQCTNTAPYLMILESAPNGNLKSFLMEHRHEAESLISKNQLINFALDAGSGLACLHRHEYIHNDLAARNCLVMEDYCVKIGDYGISDTLFKEDYLDTSKELLPLRWMAPESLVETDGMWTSHISEKSADIWSFGVLMWEIMSLGHRPYAMLTDEAVLQGVVVENNLHPSQVETSMPYKENLNELMRHCWCSPSERPDIDQICQLLGQLVRTRMDTMDSEFDQKWNTMLPNREGRVSSGVSETGSKKALAGSFVTAGSASPNDMSLMTSSGDSTADHSLLREELDMKNIATSTPAKVNQTLERTSSPKEQIISPKSTGQQLQNSMPVKAEGPSIVSPVSRKIENHQTVSSFQASESHNSFTSVSKEADIIETPESPSISDSVQSNDKSNNRKTQVEKSLDEAIMAVNSPGVQQTMTTSTPKNHQSLNSTAQFYSAESSRNNTFATAIEEVSPPSVNAEDTDFLSAMEAQSSAVGDSSHEQFESVAETFSLDSNNLSLSGFSEETLLGKTVDLSQNTSNQREIAGPCDGEASPVDEFNDFVHIAPQTTREDFINIENSLGSELFTDETKDVKADNMFEVKREENGNMCSEISGADIHNGENKGNENIVTSEECNFSFIEKSEDVLIESSFLSSTNSNVSADADKSNSLDSKVLLSDLSTFDTDSFIDIQSPPSSSSNVGRSLASHDLLEDGLMSSSNNEADIQPQNNAMLLNLFDNTPSGQEHSIMSNASLISNPDEFLQFQTTPNTIQVSAFSELEAPMSDTQNFAPLQTEDTPPVKDILCELEKDLLPTVNGFSSDFSIAGFEEQPPLSSNQQNEMLIPDFVSEQVGIDSKWDHPSHSTEYESGINSHSVTGSLSFAGPASDHFNISDSLNFAESSRDRLDSSSGLADISSSPPDIFSSSLYRSSNIQLSPRKQAFEPDQRPNSPESFGSNEDSDCEVCSDTSSTSDSGKEYNCKDVFLDTGQPPTVSIFPNSTENIPESSEGAVGNNSPSSILDFDEQALKIVSEIYLSRGVKSPRRFEVPPLETIPEHQPMPTISEDLIFTPSDSSSLEVKYEDLFGSDGFEWDDFYEDPIMGKDTDSNYSFQDQPALHDGDISEWSYDIDTNSIHSSNSLQSKFSEDAPLNQSTVSETAAEAQLDFDKALKKCLSDSELVTSSSSSKGHSAISGKSLVSSILSQRNLRLQSEAKKNSSLLNNSDTVLSSDGIATAAALSSHWHDASLSSASLPTLPSTSSSSLPGSSTFSPHSALLVSSSSTNSTHTCVNDTSEVHCDEPPDV